MRWIVGTSLKFRFIVVALAASLLFFGVHRVDDAPVDVFPEFAPPRVEIQTVAWDSPRRRSKSWSPSPWRQALNGVPGVGDIRSKSVEQLSSIVLLFEGARTSSRRASWCKSASRPSLRACRPGRRRR